MRRSARGGGHVVGFILAFGLIGAIFCADDARAAAIVSIGNGAASPDGSYLNAGNIANTLAFTNSNIAATTSIDVVDPIDLSTSSLFGPTFGTVNFGAPTININNSLLMGAGNIGLGTVTTINLSAPINGTAGLLGPSRFITNSTVTQVNVLAAAASVQQAIDLSSNTNAVTVNVATGQYNENVSVGKSITLTSSLPGGQTNNGVFKLLSSAITTTLGGTSFTNSSTGTIAGVGTLNVSGLTGAGFLNHGVVAPGLSPGMLSVSGNYNQASDGDLEIEIGGTTVGTQYDRLAVSGSAALSGFLHATLINAFTPSASDTFSILTTSNRTGTFANAPSIVSTDGGFFQVTYTPTSVVLGNFQVPEPAAGAIMAIGLVAAVGHRRHRGRAA